MNITLKVEKTYSFEIGDRRFEGFREVSSWEGFSKYANGKSWIVLLKSRSGIDLFEPLFGTTLEFPLVTASQDVAEAIEAKKRCDEALNREAFCD